tara:strand:+ start:32 stop:337 length:306 start_codon:yes stop_codon:yes gene_type:complete
MNITTVELTKTGEVFIVNQGLDNEIFVPDDMANRHRVMIQEWIDAGNTPTPYAEPELTYVDKRRAEYNELNQFEMIGEDAINGTTTHADAIKAIKDKYPKE